MLVIAIIKTDLPVTEELNYNFRIVRNKRKL